MIRGVNVLFLFFLTSIYCGEQTTTPEWLEEDDPDILDKFNVNRKFNEIASRDFEEELTDGNDFQRVLGLIVESDKNYRNNEALHIVQSPTDDEDLDLVQEYLNDESFDKTGQLRYSSVPVVERELIDELLDVIFSRVDYIRYLNNPSKDQMTSVIREMLRMPTQKVLQQQLFHKILASRAYYEKYVSPLLEDNRRQQLLDFAQHLLRSHENGELSTDDTIAFDKKMRNIAFFDRPDDVEFRSKVNTLMNVFGGRKIPSDSDSEDDDDNVLRKFDRKSAKSDESSSTAGPNLTSSTLSSNSTTFATPMTTTPVTEVYGTTLDELEAFSPTLYTVGPTERHNVENIIPPIPTVDANFSLLLTAKTAEPSTSTSQTTTSNFNVTELTTPGDMITAELNASTSTTSVQNENSTESTLMTLNETDTTITESVNSTATTSVFDGNSTESTLKTLNETDSTTMESIAPTSTTDIFDGNATESTTIDEGTTKRYIAPYYIPPVPRTTEKPDEIVTETTNNSTETTTLESINSTSTADDYSRIDTATPTGEDVANSTSTTVIYNSVSDVTASNHDLIVPTDVLNTSTSTEESTNTTTTDSSTSSSGNTDVTSINVTTTESSTTTMKDEMALVESDQ